MHQHILQYLAFSQNFWEMPSGGFSFSGYPRESGYAHEEWNFNTEDVVDGYIYGYMYKTPQKKYSDTINGSYSIYFHTKNPKTKDWSFVGLYKNSFFIDSAEKERVKRIWKRNGIIDRRAREIFISPISRFRTLNDAKKHYLRDFALTVKVKKDDVYLFNPPLKLIPGKTKKYLMNKGSIATRYSTYNYLKSEIPLDFKEISDGKKSFENIESKYIRTNRAQIIEITKRHKLLLTNISSWYKNQGYKVIKEDQDFIDLLVEKKGAQTLIELKIVIDKKTKYSIREALGQILEYDHRQNGISLGNLLIILDKRPSDHDKAFINSIREKFNIPLNVSTFYKGNFLSD